MTLAFFTIAALLIFSFAAYKYKRRLLFHSGKEGKKAAPLPAKAINRKTALQKRRFRRIKVVAYWVRPYLRQFIKGFYRVKRFHYARWELTRGDCENIAANGWTIWEAI